MPINQIPAIDSKGISRQFMIQDYVCCEVLEVTDQYPQILLGMQAIHRRFDNGPPLGLIKNNDFPQFYK